MSNSKKEKELEIDEEKAYFELCQIISEAIQTQDANLLEIRINEWKRKYPYNKFSKNLKAKIDYILNQYYSELIEYIIKTIKTQEEKKKFNQSKSLVELYKIIKSTNDIKDLKKKVDKWKSNYPIDDFMKMYKSKVQRYTSQKYLEENSFDTEKAFYDLYYMLKTNSTFEELKEKVFIWEKDYSIGEKYSTDDFKKHSSNVKALLDEEYLYSISKEDEKEDSVQAKENSLALQTASFGAFTQVLKSGNMSKVIEWIYKNRNISFNNFYKEQLVSKTAFKFPISMLENKKFKMDLNKTGLSFEEYQNIDSSRKYVIAMFINNLMKEKAQSETTFQAAFTKSELAKSFKMTKEDITKNKYNEEKSNESISTDIELNKNDNQIIIDLNNNFENIKDTNTQENLNVKLDDNIIKDEEPLFIIDLPCDTDNKEIEESNKQNQEFSITENNKDYNVNKTEIEEKSDDVASSYTMFNPDFLTAVYAKSQIAERTPKTVEKVDEIVSKSVEEKQMDKSEIIFYGINN